MSLKIKNEAEYQNFLLQITPNKIPAKSIPEKKTPPQKRKGVKETPILASLEHTKITVECSPTHATIRFDGARLFTLNEIYALLQYRSYIIFSYKKKWHALVHKAIKSMGKNKPHFTTPCKITIFRQGKKLIDRDSLFVMYKYIIDALKDQPETTNGLISDDNPDIIFYDEKIQTLGPPIIAVRIDLIDPPPAPDHRDIFSLFNLPPA